GIVIYRQARGARRTHRVARAQVALAAAHRVLFVVRLVDHREAIRLMDADLDQLPHHRDLPAADLEHDAVAVGLADDGIPRAGARRGTAEGARDGPRTSPSEGCIHGGTVR